MIRLVHKYIEDNCMIQDGDHLVVGVSGGADSVCLLIVLQEYQKKKNFTLSVVHMNHMIRKEAKNDALYVESLCKRLNVPFYLYECDVEKIAKEKRISTEEAGRQVRYQAFEEVLCKYDSNRGQGKIAVGHHKNDQTETVLLNLFRGTGLQGMAGIAPVRENIIRPLLCVSHKEIEDFLISRNETWCIDSTNDEDTYTRNKIRNNVLPYIETQINQNAVSHIASTADMMRKLRDYVDAEVKVAFMKVVKKDTDGIEINLLLFKELPSFMQEQVILAVFEEMTPARKDIGKIHVQDLIELCDKQGYHRVSLPYGLEGIKSYQTLQIRILKEKKDQAYYQEILPPNSYELENGDCIEFSIFTREKEIKIEQKTYTKWFDYDKIINCLVLRNRQTGDYLTINDALQKKTVKQYMIEEKIPKEKRDEILLLSDGNHVLWMIGKRISEAYKVTENTSHILCVEYKKRDSF